MLTLSDLEIFLTEKGIPFSVDSNNFILFNIRVIDLTGNFENFKLEASPDDKVLQIREVNKRFPRFCPNRHINAGGYFCLGLEQDLKLMTIAVFYQCIKEFLKIQLQVEKLKQWPYDQPEWSHGDAAVYQKIVEDKLKTINLKQLGFRVSDLTLVAKNNKTHRYSPYFHIYHLNQLIFTVLNNKPHNKRQSCICSPHGRHKHKTLGQCDKQCAKVIYDIIINEQARIEAENNFWKTMKSCKIQCCGSMDKCELK